MCVYPTKSKVLHIIDLARYSSEEVSFSDGSKNGGTAHPNQYFFVVIVGDKLCDLIWVMEMVYAQSNGVGKAPILQLEQLLEMSGMLMLVFIF